MEFTAADGARGRGETADGSTNAHGKEVTDKHSGEDHHANESQRLAVQLGDAGVGAGLIEAALRHDGPDDFWQSAEGGYHFHRAIFHALGKANGWRASQLLRDGANLLNQ